MSVVTFDDLSNPSRVLSGQYPSGVIDWGTNTWWLSGPYAQDSTNSVSFNGAGPTSASFNFLVSRALLQFDAVNGGTASSMVSVSCPGQPTQQANVAAGQILAIQTQWTAACSPVTLGSTNGWDTNFDNLVIQAASTATPTNTPTSVSTSTPTAQTTSTPTPPGSGTVTFDDLTNPNRVLNGQYPSGLIDWGTNSWWLSGAYAGDTTNSVSFNGSGPTLESFSLLGSHQLLQLDAVNGDSAPATVTLSCAGQPSKSVTLAAGQISTIKSGWTGTCAKVTVASSNGWMTNFDNLVIQ